MKTITFLTLALALSFSVMAQDLRENMKQSGVALKAIAKTINNPSKNAENAALTAKIIKNMKAAQEQKPDGVTGEESIADYKAMIEVAITNLVQLQDAFLKNDNVAAANILTKVNAAKNEGHDKYRKD